MKRIGLALSALVGGAGAGEPEEFRPSLDLSGWVQLDDRRAASPGPVPEHELTPRRVRVRFSGVAAPRLSYVLGLEGDNAGSGNAAPASPRT